MQFQTFDIQYTNGSAAPGVSVMVYLANTVTPATVYDENGNELMLPLVSGVRGQVAFAAASGDYDLRATVNGVEITVENVQFFDRDSVSFRGFTTRAAAEAGDTGTGNRLSVGGIDYIYDADGTALTTGDSRTWSPAGDATPQHWGASSDGGSDTSAAIVSMAAWCAGSTGRNFAEFHGRYLIDSEAVIDLDGTLPGEHIAFAGGGMNTQTLLVNNATGGIHFDGINVGRQHSVQLSDMQFTPQLTESGYPFKITGATGGLSHQNGAVINNVYAGALAETGGLDFTVGPSITGLYRPRICNLQVAQPTDSANKWAHGLDIGTTYNPFINDAWINVAGGGADYGIKNVGTTEEAGYYGNVTINGADTGFYYERTGREPGFQWIGGHINHTGVGFRLNGVKYGVIYGPLMYSQNVGATDAVDFLLEDVDGLLIDNPQFRFDGNDKRHFTLEPKSGKAGAVVRRVHIRLGVAALFADTPVAPIYCNGATEVVIEIPDATTTGDLVSYPERLVEMGPSQDPAEVKIITTSGMTAFGDGATSGPVHILERFSSSPAVGDYLGQNAYYGRNSNGASEMYARRSARILAPTAAAELGQIDDEIMIDGALAIALRLIRGAASGETAMFVAVRDGATHSLKRVSVGADDSGGTGFRVLLVPNA